MWTREELLGIRERAELEASISGTNEHWRHACFNLASAASHLESVTHRIEHGEITAIPQQASEE